MSGKQELCWTAFLSVLVLFLCALPFVVQGAWEKSQMREFLAQEGSFLRPSDIVLSLSYSKALGDTTISSSFKSESMEHLPLRSHGRLPEEARLMALGTVNHRSPPSCLQSDWEGDFDYSPGWLVLYDRSQNVGWMFVSH